jgi:magnesium chelatase family protein
MVSRYQKRISGPLLDRIDIHIEVPRVAYEKLSDDRLGEPSGVIQARVEAARECQQARLHRQALARNPKHGYNLQAVIQLWTNRRLGAT